MSKCSTSYSLAYIQDGTDGKNGTSVTITSKSIEYVTSDSGTTTPSDSAAWTDTPAPEKGKYLWSRTTINYSDANKTWSTVTYSVSYIGTNGQDGASGRGIKSIQEKYAISDSDTTAPSPFYDEVKTPTPEKRFLWNYEIITYTDGKSEPTASRVIGVYGEAGKDGEDGNGISSVVSKYLATTASSGVTTGTSGWDTAVPTLKEGQYLWSYETITYTKTNPVNTTPRIIGSYGKQGEKGTSGAYTLFKYALNNDAQNAPATSSFTSTMPAITTTNPYLWIMVGNVAAGKTDSDAVWSSPTLLGTDSSEVYAKLEETKTSFNTQITEITKEGGTIETKIGEYKIDGTNTIATVIQQTQDSITTKVSQTEYDSKIEKIESSISQNSNEIALKVGLSDDGTQFVMNEKTITMRGENILIKGSVKADQLDVDSLMSRKLEIQTNGSIESSNYETSGGTEGFKIDAGGHIDAQDITIGGDVVFGGVVDNDAIRTQKTDQQGNKYKTKDGSFIYNKKDEVYNLITSKVPTLSKCVASNISSSPVLVSGGTNYYAVANISPANETIISESSTTWTATTVTNYSKTLYGKSFSFTVDCPCIVNVTFDLPWLYTVISTGDGRAYDYHETIEYIYYSLDGGTYTRINVSKAVSGSYYGYSEQLSGESSEISHNYYYSFSLSFSSAGTHTLQLKSEEYSTSGNASSTAFLKDISYALSVTKKTTLSGYYAFVTPFSYTALSTIYNGWSSYFNNVSFSYNGTTLSSLSKYGLFAGLQKAVATTDSDGNTTYESFADTTDNFSISATDIVVNGVNRGDGTVSFNGGNLSVVANGTAVASILKGAYYTSYPSVSFTELSAQKGTYVSDLFPMTSGDSSIGSANQPFAAVHANNFYGGTFDGGFTSNAKQEFMKRALVSHGYGWQDGGQRFHKIVKINSFAYGDDFLVFHISARGAYFRLYVRFDNSGGIESAYMENPNGSVNSLSFQIYAPTNYTAYIIAWIPAWQKIHITYIENPGGSYGIEYLSSDEVSSTIQGTNFTSI